ncbi:MAG: NAD(P)H-dependent oxidoreductase [Alphaproteobacteria bacterium]|nr:NAD(P)H-dependent oxidoreductase [Alphaproteobacteria bacterium]
MLDIVAICGSLRAASTNGALIEAARLLAPAGMTVTRHDAIGTLPHFNADLDGPGLPEPVAAFRARLKAADGIILSSPEYARGIPGTLKNALDWLVGDGDFENRPVALLGASARGVAGDAALRLVLGTMGGRVIEAASVTVDLLGGTWTAERIAAEDAMARALRDALAAFGAEIERGVVR